jgi:hypothetical protein
MGFPIIPKPIKPTLFFIFLLSYDCLENKFTTIYHPCGSRNLFLVPCFHRDRPGFPLEFTPYLIRGENDTSILMVRACLPCTSTVQGRQAGVINPLCKICMKKKKGPSGFQNGPSKRSFFYAFDKR